MKINYTTTVRERADSIRIAVDVEEESEPFEKRKVWYQPTVVIVTFNRCVLKNSAGRDRDEYEWITVFHVQGMRVLKAGGIGTQAANLWIYDEDQYPWLRKAMDLAKSKFHKIISGWPDPQWSPRKSTLIL